MYIDFGIFIMIIGLLGICYGNSVTNRNICVICGKNMPCQFNSCSPVGIESNILYHIYHIFNWAF